MRIDASRFKVFAKLAPASLGIYLVHPALIRVFAIAGLSIPAIAHINASPLQKVIVICILSLVMTLVLLRVPVLKKIVE